MSLIKEKVGNIEEKTREGISRSTRKDVVGCVQCVVSKKRFLVQFEYGKKKYMSAYSLSYLCKKEEVGQEEDDNKSDHPKKQQGELLTIDGDTDAEEP